jgi:RNA polymerase sigma-70 factor (sigma-E family)
VDTDSRPPRRETGEPGGDASAAVTALYQAHAVGLIRLAIIMVGDRTAAEDVVQEAFVGLYRHWGRLSDPAKALTYLRSTVLNGSRSALRQRSRQHRREQAHGWSGPDWDNAEYQVMVGEEHRLTLAAIRRLPDRQREALVLRFYLEMSEEGTARAMGISRGTVKSATSRALAALARMLRDSERWDGEQ